MSTRNDRLIGTMFRKADARHARAFQADGRAINEKVRLYARVGAALIAARDNKQDAFDAITAIIPWGRFLASVEEAKALARSESSMPTRCSASTMPAYAVADGLASIGCGRPDGLRALDQRPLASARTRTSKMQLVCQADWF